MEQKLSSGSGLTESKSVESLSYMQKLEGQRALFVDRGVGSPRILKLENATTVTVDSTIVAESKNSMAATAGLLQLIRCLDQKRIDTWQLSWLDYLHVEKLSSQLNSLGIFVGWVMTPNTSMSGSIEGLSM